MMLPPHTSADMMLKGLKTGHVIFFFACKFLISTVYYGKLHLRLFMLNVNVLGRAIWKKIIKQQ